jgi:hypothetical protein
LRGLGLGQSGSDNEGDRMIISALALPTTKDTTSLSVDFYTSEPIPDSHWHTCHEDAVAGADTSPAENNSMMPCPVFCIPCDVNISEGGDNSNQVQCQ